MKNVPALERIEEAERATDPIFLGTPQFELDALNDLLGFRLVCKLETLNPIRSFKGRGTSWLVAQLEKRNKGRQIVCASAGNFGQGMAYACRERNIPLTVFAAENANALKLERMSALGAEVQLEGDDFDAAKEAARAYARTSDLTFVEDARDIETAEGAGTIGLELCRYPEKLDAVLVPLGNGALINGIGAYLKARSLSTEIVGVVASGAPSMDLSWRANGVITTERADTIADGIGVRLPIAEALQAMRHTVDDIVQVADKEILDAMRLAHERVGVVLEPSGAVGLAAAQIHKERFRDKLVATVFCGSNLTPEQIKTWLF